MRRKIILFATMLVFGFSILAFTSIENHNTEAEKAIKEVILKSYVNGAFNALDADAMRNGFHPDFAIFSANGEDINKYPIATWAEKTEKRKSDPEFDAAKNKWDHKFASVDVTGGSAAVKIELSRDGELRYTDYLIADGKLWIRYITVIKNRKGSTFKIN